MINKFKLESINDIYEVEHGVKLYILNLKALTRDLHYFGIDIDGEDYKDDCWLVEIHDKDHDSIEELFYITFDVVREKYCDITPEFKKYILEELKKLIENEYICKGWDILLDETVKELIDLYEYEISDIEDGLLKLYDKQLDEYIVFSKEGLINYFAMDCEYRYSIDGNVFHINKAKELKKLIK